MNNWGDHLPRVGFGGWGTPSGSGMDSGHGTEEEGRRYDF